jgi:uncharacterized membrane protein YsdA (DUF1294 family)/cold shock CspA family protein
MAMRHLGTITTWKDTEGYGFITPNRGGARVFVHISAFPSGVGRPRENDLVNYDLDADVKGRARARNVSYVRNRNLQEVSASGVAIAGTICTGFLVVLAGLAYKGTLPAIVVLLYVGLSLLSFLVYAFDKSAAIGKRWRTAESRLHLLSLLGGWPGALVAQRMFRHKSSKMSFQIEFWIIVAVNCGMLAWAMSEHGKAVIDGLFH